MAVTKRNYVPGEFEAFTGESAGVITYNEWQYFVLDEYFKFEISDGVFYADGVLLAPSEYDLATDVKYTDIESTRSGKTLYGMIKITNAALDGQALTADGNNFGTMTDNEAAVAYTNAVSSDPEVVEITINTNAVTNTIYLVDTTAGAVTVTLPAVLEEGFMCRVYKITSIETEEVTIDGNGNNISGVATQEIIGESEGLSVVSDGEYFIVQDNRGGLQRKLSQSTGVLSGFASTTNADTISIDIGEGIYNIEDATDMLNPVSKELQYDGVVGYPISNLSTEGITFVYIDVNKNLVQQTNITTSPEFWRTHARIATVQHFFGTGAIEVTLDYATPPQNPSSRLSTYMNTLGIIRESIVVSGASANNLRIANTSGVLVSPGSNQTDNSLNPDNVPISAADPIAAIVYLTQNDVNRLDTGAGAVVDVANYDVAGTITAIAGPNATSVIHRVYMGIDGTIAVQYGQNTYSTLQSAKDALFSGEDTYVENPILKGITTLLCYVISTKVATDLNDTSHALFFVTDKFGGGGTISGGGAGASTMQEAYENSLQNPEITTNATRGSLDIRRGSAADTDDVLTVQNAAGTKILAVTGDKVSSTDGTSTLSVDYTAAAPLTAGLNARGATGGWQGGFGGFLSIFSDFANRIGLTLTHATGFKLLRTSTGGVTEQAIEFKTDGTIAIDEPTTTETDAQNATRGASDSTALVSFGGLAEATIQNPSTIFTEGTNVTLAAQTAVIRPGRITLSFKATTSASVTSLGSVSATYYPLTTKYGSVSDKDNQGVAVSFGLADTNGLLAGNQGTSFPIGQYYFTLDYPIA